MKKILKICGWGALGIVLLFAFILIVGSPIAKYVVNNHGEDIIGRKTHADRIIINPFSGGVTINGFECKEQNGTTNFVSFNELYVEIAYPMLLARYVHLRAIHLEGFKGQVLRDSVGLNLTDIIDRFSSKDSIEQPKDTTPSKWEIALDDIRIDSSTVRYRDVVNNKQWKLEDLTLRIPGLYFDNTQTNAGLEFAIPTGGRVGIVAGYKMLANRYAVRVTLDSVHTHVALPLVQDYLNVSGLGAVINGQIHVDGSLENVMNLQVQGALSMTGLSLRDLDYHELAALDEMRVVLDQIDLNTNSFILDTLSITGITGEYEVHDTWNTLSKLLKEQKKESGEPKVESDTTASLKEEEPLPITWMAKKVILNGHDLKYCDYSMPNNWSYAIKTLDVEGENVANNGRNNIRLNATLTGNAKLKADFVGGLDMKREDTRMNMKLTGVRLTDFDAICRNYTSYPLEGGVLSVQSKIDVRRAKMNGNNHIEIDKPDVGMKDLSSDAPYKNIPLQLGFKMLTSAQNMIVLDVPVEGDVSNPQFSFRKIIGRALGKVFFGPLMGAGDKRKSKVSEEEMAEMQLLMGED